MLKKYVKAHLFLRMESTYFAENKLASQGLISSLSGIEKAQFYEFYAKDYFVAKSNMQNLEIVEFRYENLQGITHFNTYYITLTKPRKRNSTILIEFDDQPIEEKIFILCQKQTINRL